MGMLMPSTYVPGYSRQQQHHVHQPAAPEPGFAGIGERQRYGSVEYVQGIRRFHGRADVRRPADFAWRSTALPRGVPNSDIVRVERAYFTWNKIGGLPLYLSIGRRPSTDGPPMNFRDDEMRGGTPSGALDRLSVRRYHGRLSHRRKSRVARVLRRWLRSRVRQWRTLKLPADRLKDVQFFGGNFDIFNNEKTFMQSTIARAWNVTDGFNGQMVLPMNPVTGDPHQCSGDHALHAEREPWRHQSVRCQSSRRKWIGRRLQQLELVEHSSEWRNRLPSAD